MHVKAGVALEPSGDRGMFMGGVIVGDDVDVEITWGLLIDGFEKGVSGTFPGEAIRGLIQIAALQAARPNSLPMAKLLFRVTGSSHVQAENLPRPKRSSGK
jgi:hypothetical protein